MAIQATAVSRVILTRLHGNRVQSMYVAAWRWWGDGEPEHEQELAHACARTGREITICHLVCVTQHFFFFLCDEAIQ